MGGVVGSVRITLDRLREVLTYKSDTGLFYWNVSLCRKVKAGSVAGFLSDRGYLKIVIDKKRYMASRLAWFYFYGEWPEYEIDHKNRNRSDNRINNLREATRSENNRNSGPKGISGYKGVSWNKEKGKWEASITISRKKKFLGRFDTPEEAYRVFFRYATQVDNKFYAI